MDLFSTNYLLGVVQDLKVPPSWALSKFFGSIAQDDSEEIHFDIVDRKRRVAPFVSPNVPGKIMDAAGRRVATFKPAYTKDKRVFDTNRPFKRSVGETIGGAIPATQRAQLAIVEELSDQLNMLDRRLEVMAMEALRTGKLVISGDNYPAVTVDFLRDATLSPVALAGVARWNDAATTANPLDDLRTWALLTLKAGGAWPSEVIMAADTFQAFINHAKVKERWLSLNANTQGTLLGGARLTEGGTYMGSIDQFNIYVYAGWYIDEAGNENAIMTDSWVIMASPAVEGVRAFGAIKDHDSLQAVPFFPKSWLEQDPSIRYLMLQSAPLIVPARPNATFARKVLV